MDEVGRLKEENKQLRSALRSLIGWSTGGTCNDCIPFRRSPADIEFQHHKSCAYLEAVNEARQLIGDFIEDGHEYDDPEAEMERLAQERLDWCRAQGLIK